MQQQPLDFSQFNSQLTPLWQAQDLLGVVEHFNNYQQLLDGQCSSSSYEHFQLYGIIPIKWYSMQQLGDERGMADEIASVLQANQGLDGFLACLCNSLDQRAEFLLDYYQDALQKPSRVISAARVRYASQRQDMLNKVLAIAEFNRIGEQLGKHNWPAKEQELSLWHLETGELLFRQQDVTRVNYRELPNDNIYLEVEYQRADSSANLQLPLPSNDAICESGYLTLDLAGETRHIDINRYQVVEYLVHSPFGFCCHADEFEICVANLNYYRNSNT